MAFIRIKGVIGKVYVPEKSGAKKHNCKDCFSCQWCSDERCRLCLSQKKKGCQKSCRKKAVKRK